jgi:predicted DCC family thiol-disulfide oxidoreductase YuxK
MQRALPRLNAMDLQPTQSPAAPPVAAAPRHDVEASLDPDQRLVLFDGECNFCNGAVLFIVDRDPRERFVFASLQSDVGQASLKRHHCREDLDSVVLVEQGEAYVCSTAALRIAKALRFPWPILFYLGMLVPLFIRNWMYRYFAKHRYQWFGKTDQCRIPTPELRRRMLV